MPFKKNAALGQASHRILQKTNWGVTMRVTIFIVYGGIHVVVHLDGKIERRKSSPYPEWPPGASLGRLAQAGGVEKLQKSQRQSFSPKKSKRFFCKKITFEKSFSREKSFFKK